MPPPSSPQKRSGWFAKLKKPEVSPEILAPPLSAAIIRSDSTTAVCLEGMSAPRRLSSTVPSRSSSVSSIPQQQGIYKKPLITDTCHCCGTIIRYPADVARVRCLVCQTHYTIKQREKDANKPSKESKQFDPISYDILKELADDNDTYKLGELLYRSFSSAEVLNQSFLLNPDATPTYYSSNVDVAHVRRLYNLLRNFPSKKPFYTQLMASLELLRHPPPLTDVAGMNWLLVLLEIPLLAECLISGNQLEPELRRLCYDILKRIIGLLSHMNQKCTQYLTHWWSRLPTDELIRKIDFFNLYITFQLTRCIDYEIFKASAGPSSKYPSVQASAEDVNYKDSMRAHFIRPTSESSDFGMSIRIPLFISSGGRRLTSLARQTPSSLFWPQERGSEHNVKIKVQQYSDDWHLRTACRVLKLLFAANKTHNNVAEATFYNNLVDYVNVKQDFDSWQFKERAKKHEKDGTPNVLDYLKADSNGSYLNVASLGITTPKPLFSFCQFPFVISLGAKITILEHEASRTMEHKAEEAFIQSINKKKPFDIYFKVRVRRDYVTSDSLRCIKAHQNDFKKLLKVEFVDEAGIDAGGLKKEWFLLLTRELFDPNRGLFSYHPSSNLCYFSISPQDNDELYYLVGAVLGLSIYNSTILDLQLPKALYKKLMGHKVTLADFTELDPDTGKGLSQLLQTKNTEQLGIYFEITYKDIFDQVRTTELLKGGSELLVNDGNKYEYVERYLNFFLNDVCQRPFGSFLRGFYSIMGDNALSLFSPEEIELLLVGDDSNRKLDISIMKSVTKYKGFTADDKTIRWFWDYMDQATPEQQKKVLLFVTGTNRLPATGLPSLHFKITRMREPERLPVAHTCFNELCLAEYVEQVDFAKRMEMALSYCEGFGLK